MTVHMAQRDTAPSADLLAAAPGSAQPGPPTRGATAPLAPLYPVGLLVEGRRCLVVGGGTVAAHKVRSLVRCGALVTVVAPELHDSLRLLSTSAGPRGNGAAGTHPIEVQARPYRRGDAAAGYRLVVAATGDPDVDAAVYEDAEAAGVWVNAADDPAHCSVVLPAVWRTGAVTISVSTDGESPAVASWLRTRVAEAVGARTGQLAALCGQARRRLKEEGRPTGSVDWLAILEGPVPRLVAEGRLAEARAAVAAACGWSDLFETAD